MNKLNSTFSMQINAGFRNYWCGAYHVFAASSYTDTLLGKSEDMESRKLEMPCNEPWVLIYTEVCNNTSKLSVVGFDGVDIKQHFFDDSKFWHPFFSDLCDASFDNTFNVNDYSLLEDPVEFLHHFDELIDEAICDAFEKYCQEHDCNDCKLKCNEAQGLLS